MGSFCLLEPNSSASSETCASSLPKGCSGASGFGLNMLIDDRVVEMLLLCVLARPGVAGDWKLFVEIDMFLDEMLLLGVATLDMERLRAITSEFFLVCDGALLGILGTSVSGGVGGK